MARIVDLLAGLRRIADDRPWVGSWVSEHVELKCSGLAAAELARRAVEPSTLSLLGLVRHMADVERGWFRRIMGARAHGRGVRQAHRHADLLRQRIDGAVGQ